MRLADFLSPREQEAFRLYGGGRLRNVEVAVESGVAAFAARSRVRSPGPICFDCPPSQTLPARDFHPINPAADTGLVQVAASLPGLTVIARRAWEPGTASLFALARHEDVHQGQFDHEPNFSALYEVWERRREKMGLPPYANPWEFHAYAAEVEAYLYAIRELGLPPGRRRPLLLTTP